MDNLFAYIRPTLSILFPFIVMHYLASYFYQLSILDLAKWWSANIFKVENTGAYMFGLFFYWLVLSMSFSGFMNTFYLSIVGQKQELVYLGHDTQSHAVYYKLDDNSKTPISGFDSDAKYNYSFDNLFRSQHFKMDPLMPDTPGTKANRFAFVGYISVILMLTTFLLFFLPVCNAFIHPVYKALQPTNIITLEGSMPAFEQILAYYRISKGWYFALIPLLLFSWMLFTILIPANPKSAPWESSPSAILPGELIQGYPVEIEKEYYDHRRSDGSYTSKDSGYRFVNFRFEYPFSRPVYVATKIHKKSHTDLLKQLDQKIRHKEPMKVLIDENLRLSLPEDPDRNKHANSYQ